MRNVEPEAKDSDEKTPSEYLENELCVRLKRKELRMDSIVDI